YPAPTPCPPQPRAAPQPAPGLPAIRRRSAHWPATGLAPAASTRHRWNPPPRGHRRRWRGNAAGPSAVASFVHRRSAGAGAKVPVKELLHAGIELDLVVEVVETMAFLGFQDVFFRRTPGLGQAVFERPVLRDRHTLILAALHQHHRNPDLVDIE